MVAFRKKRAAKFGAVGSHTEQEWENVLRKQHWCCFYCNEEMTELTWTREHVIPLSRGGTDYIANVVAACRSCNSKKHTSTASEFLERIYKNKKVQQKPKRANFDVEKRIRKFEAINEIAVEQDLKELWKRASNVVEPKWIAEEYRRFTSGEAKISTEEPSFSAAVNRTSTEDFHTGGKR